MIDTTEMEQRLAAENTLPSSLIPLEQLAWNYWWSWAPDGISIFRDLDPELWEECEHNPRELFARIDAYRLAQLATDPVYLERVRRIGEAFNNYLAPGPTWSADDGPTAITTEK